MEEIIYLVLLISFCIVHTIFFIILNRKIDGDIKTNFKNISNNLMKNCDTFEQLAKNYFDKNNCKAKIQISNLQTNYSIIKNIFNISNNDNTIITKLNYSYFLYLINTAIMFNQKNTGFEVLKIFYNILKTFLYIGVFLFFILHWCGLIVLKPLYIGIFVLYIVLILLLALLVYNKGKKIYDKIIICCEKEIASNDEFTKDDQKEIHLALVNAKKPSLLKIFVDYSKDNF